MTNCVIRTPNQSDVEAEFIAKDTLLFRYFQPVKICEWRLLLYDIIYEANVYPVARYAEIVQILYSANDLIISDSNVLENLPLLFSPPACKCHYIITLLLAQIPLFQLSVLARAARYSLMGPTYISGTCLQLRSGLLECYLA